MTYHGESRNHHLDGIVILGIPPTPAKREVVKGTKDLIVVCWKKRGKKSKKYIYIKIASKNAFLTYHGKSRNHHLDGIVLLGIPPTTAKRAGVKGTNDSNFLLKKRGKNSKKN